MKNKYFFIFYILLLSTFLACTEAVIEPPVGLFGSNFLPLQKGHAVEYRVEQITYREFDPTDTLIYYLREEVGDTISDFIGEGITQQLFRYSRLDTMSAWQLDSVWSIKQDFNRIIKTENNIPFIKLVLPLDRDSNWNGNALNSLDFQNYTLQDFLIPYENYTRSFKVIHQEDSSLVDKNVKWERFAENVGLIESQQISLQYISDISDPFYGTDSITRGVYIYKKIINSEE